jgi:tetratricopeptide (TPR) repeat protein
MEEYLKALPFLEKAFEIRQKTLPPNHPSMAASYNNIAGVYDNMGEYSKALSIYERALGILLNVLPAKHPHIQAIQKSITVLKGKL